METHNIDSFFKKIINGSADFYNTKADKSKEKIWQQIQAQKKNQSQSLWLRFLAIACILLIIFSTVMSISYIKARKSAQTIEQAYKFIKINAKENPLNSAVSKTQIVESRTHSTDTIYKEKKVIVYQPLISKIKVIDTVYIKQAEDIEPNKQVLAEANKSTKEDDSSYQNIIPDYKKEILINNSELNKKEQRKKLQIKIGGDKNQEYKGTFALTTNF
jgi:hypothetical protein